MRRTELKRSKGLAPKSLVARHNRKIEKLLEAEERRYWRQTVTRGGCVMCARFPVSAEVRRERALELSDVQGHHVLEKSALKRHGHEDKLWDERNGCGLCGYHHPRHTGHVQRMPRELVPPSAYEFAEEVRLSWLLDVEYPP